MTPALSQNNLTDGIVAETKFSTKKCRPFACGMPGSYLQNYLSGKYLGVSAILKRMSGISLWGIPLKVRKDVVGSYKIDMIYLGQVVRVGDECDPHQPMDHKALSGSIISGQSNAAITILVRFRRHKFSRLSAGLCPAHPSVSNGSTKTADTSNAGYLVKFFKTGDRPPFLMDHAISPKLLDSTLTNARIRGTSQTKELTLCP